MRAFDVRTLVAERKRLGEAYLEFLQYRQVVRVRRRAGRSGQWRGLLESPKWSGGDAEANHLSPDGVPLH
jgi:hypothetical protein